VFLPKAGALLCSQETAGGTLPRKQNQP